MFGSRQQFSLNRPVSRCGGPSGTCSAFQGPLRACSGRPANSLRSDSAGRLSCAAPKRP